MTNTSKKSETPNADAFDMLCDAYIEMARRAKYRPGAPSDGFGNIVGPLNPFIQNEAGIYVNDYMWSERRNEFYVGCANYRARPALMWTIEAARNICGMNYIVAGRLLEMAREGIADKKSVRIFGEAPK